MWVWAKNGTAWDSGLVQKHWANKRFHSHDNKKKGKKALKKQQKSQIWNRAWKFYILLKAEKNQKCKGLEDNEVSFLMTETN